MAGWTKGSRFYLISPYIVLLSAAMALKFDDITPFITVTTTWMGLAGTKSAIDTHKGNGG